MGVPGKVALQRRHLRRRDERRFADQVQLVMDVTGFSRSYAVEWLLDPGNETICERCGWTANMACPECTGCGCERSCSGWRHSEYADDDDEEWYDRTECEGCGAGHEYECVCYTRTADEVDDEPERDYWQEWKDDQMQRPQEEPADDYWHTGEDSPF